VGVFQGLASELLCEDPLLPVKVNLAKVSLCLGISIVTNQVHVDVAAHATTLDGIVDLTVVFVLSEFLGQDAVG